MSQPPTDNSIDLICPECGYDLRAIDSGRCPECGTPFDRATATRSTIPWANRATIGRVRGYWRTVWFATARARDLSAEITRPVSWRDAQRFRLITVCLASMTPIVMYIAAVQIAGGTPSVFPDLGAPSPGGATLPPALDLTLPWAAGMLLWATVPIAIFLCLLLVSGVATYWFAPKSIPIPRQNRSLAISSYACAPLIWTVIPLIFGTGLIVLGESNLLPNRMRFQTIVLGGLIGGGLVIGIFFITWLNTLRLLRRCADASGLRMTSCAMGLPIAWCLSIVIAFGAMPWLVGYIFLIIDSLRR